jgi:hypothetical protein
MTATPLSPTTNPELPKAFPASLAMTAHTPSPTLRSVKSGALAAALKHGSATRTRNSKTNDRCLMVEFLPQTGYASEARGNSITAREILGQRIEEHQRRSGERS